MPALYYSKCWFSRCRGIFLKTGCLICKDLYLFVTEATWVSLLQKLEGYGVSLPALGAVDEYSYWHRPSFGRCEQHSCCAAVCITRWCGVHEDDISCRLQVLGSTHNWCDNKDCPAVAGQTSRANICACIFTLKSTHILKAILLLARSWEHM